MPGSKPACFLYFLGWSIVVLEPWTGHTHSCCMISILFAVMGTCHAGHSSLYQGSYLTQRNHIQVRRWPREGDVPSTVFLLDGTWPNTPEPSFRESEQDPWKVNGCRKQHPKGREELNRPKGVSWSGNDSGSSSESSRVLVDSLFVLLGRWGHHG